MLFKSVSDLTNLVKTKDLPKRLRRAWKSCKTYHVIFYIVPACSHFLLYINIKTHFRLNSRIACDILYSNLFLQMHTTELLPKSKFCAWWTVPANCFKNCHIWKTSPKVAQKYFIEHKLRNWKEWLHTQTHSVQQHHIYLLGW